MERLAFSTAEAAEILGVSTSTIRRLVASGKLPTVNDVGDRILISKRTLERFANNEPIPA